MNVRDIKLKAKSVLVNRNNIVTVFVFISVITTLANYWFRNWRGDTISFIDCNYYNVALWSWECGNCIKNSQ